jgi:hypothetical protein
MNYTRNKNFLQVRDLYRKFNNNNNNNNNNGTIKSYYRDYYEVLYVVIKKGKKNLT